MKILAIDAATVCGFAFGDSNCRPDSFSERLKDGTDDPERAFKKMGIRLRDLFSVDLPDLVIVEAPISVGAMVERDEESDRGFRFKSNPNTFYLLTGLVASVFTICGPYGVRAHKANVQTVRKDFLGKARPTDPKKAVVDRCVQLGWLERGCRDHNRADALALWSFACGQYASRLSVLSQAMER